MVYELHESALVTVIMCVYLIKGFTENTDFHGGR